MYNNNDKNFIVPSMLSFINKVNPLFTILPQLRNILNLKDNVLNINQPSHFDLIKNEIYEKIHIFGNDIHIFPDNISKPSCINWLLIEKTSLESIPSLSYLKINHIKICNNKNLKFFTFDLNSNLKTLDLSNNNLVFFELKSDQPATIERLDVSNNKLFCFSDCFLKLPNLKTLDLKNNRLKYIQSSIKDIKHLQSIDLQNNPLEIYSSIDGSFMGWFDIIDRFRNNVTLSDLETKEKIVELIKSSRVINYWNFSVVSKIKNAKIRVFEDSECEIQKMFIFNQIKDDKVIKKMIEDSEMSFENVYYTLTMEILRITDNKNTMYLKDEILNAKNSICFFRNLLNKICPINTKNVDMLVYLQEKQNCKSNYKSVDESVSVNEKSNIDQLNQNRSGKFSYNFIRFICKSLISFKNECLNQLIFIFGSPVEEFCVFEYYREILDKFVGFDSLFDDRMKNIVSRYRKPEYEILKSFLECFELEEFVNGLVVSINSNPYLMEGYKAFAQIYYNETKSSNFEISDKEIKKMLKTLKIIDIL